MSGVMKYKSKPLRCPLMNGRTCMGRECACAVRMEMATDFGIPYACGIPNAREGQRTFLRIIDIERTDT